MTNEQVIDELFNESEACAPYGTTWYKYSAANVLGRSIRGRRQEGGRGGEGAGSG